MSTLSVILNRTAYAGLLICGLLQGARAEIQLSTSAVLIPAGKQESSIDLKNNGNKSVLLYSKIVRMPDDNLAGGTLLTDPQAILVEPGETQTVRVLYRTNTPDDKEHMARVIFTGLPSKEEIDEGKVQLIIGQDIPVVVGVRKNLEQKDLWQLAQYSIKENKLCLRNPTAKVFRFAPTMTTDESNVRIDFSKPYVLPGQELCSNPAGKLFQGMHVNITSVSDYNYELKTNKVKI